MCAGGVGLAGLGVSLAAVDHLTLADDVNRDSDTLCCQGRDCSGDEV